MTTAGEPAETEVDWGRARFRLVVLRRLRLRNLPTQRRVQWNYAAAVVTAVVGVLLFGNNRTPLSVVAALVLFGVAVVEALHGRARARASSTGRFGASWIELRLDCRPDDVAWPGAHPTVSREPTDAAGFASEAISPLFRQGAVGERRRRTVERLAQLVDAELAGGETRRLTVPASAAPHGRDRVVTYLSLGLLALHYSKPGAITVTDRRVLFHRKRDDAVVQLWEADLADFCLLEWFVGVGPLERLHSVLILQNDSGAIGRFQIRRAWRREGQVVFELLASLAAEAPEALARYWQDAERAAARVARSPAAPPPRFPTTAPAAAPAPAYVLPPRPAERPRRTALIVALAVAALIVVAGLGALAIARVPWDQLSFEPGVGKCLGETDVPEEYEVRPCWDDTTYEIVSRPPCKPPAEIFTFDDADEWCARPK
jgi:hypothetical protein